MIIKLIDRQMIRGYFKSYIVCLASLLSLYVVVDLFTNLDDFTHHNKGLWAALLRIFAYYGYKVAQIFDRLCEAIVLLAAMFTVAWMQRNNEQVPLLSAGISTRRIVTPVLMCAFFMLGMTVINQELIIPRIADKLAGISGVDPAAVLASGAAYETWCRMIRAQGGDPAAPLPVATHGHEVCAAQAGVLAGLDAHSVGVAAWRLGAGRARKEHVVQPAAGVRCLVSPGDPVAVGQPVLELHTDIPDAVPSALDALRDAARYCPDQETYRAQRAGVGLIMETCRGLRG